MAQVALSQHMGPLPRTRVEQLAG